MKRKPVRKTRKTASKTSRINPCEEAKDSLKKYHADVKAGHKDAAPYWLGKAEGYGTMCTEKSLRAKRQKSKRK